MTAKDDIRMLEPDAISQAERKEYARAVFGAAVRLSGLVSNILLCKNLFAVIIFFRLYNDR